MGGWLRELLRIPLGQKLRASIARAHVAGGPGAAIQFAPELRDTSFAMLFAMSVAVTAGPSRSTLRDAGEGGAIPNGQLASFHRQGLREPAFRLCSHFAVHLNPVQICTYNWDISPLG